MLRAFGLKSLFETRKFNRFVDIIIKAALSPQSLKDRDCWVQTFHSYNIYTHNIYKLFASDISSGPSKILKRKTGLKEKSFFFLSSINLACLVLV